MANLDEFHRVVIGTDRYFVGKIGRGGPYLLRIDYGRRSGGGIYLGDVAFMTQIRKSVMEKGWHICEYDGRNPRIDLSDLTDAQVKRVASEFGIQKDGESLRVSFYGSNAWNGLKSWVNKNAQLAQLHGESKLSQCHLGDWYSRAVLANAPADEALRVSKKPSDGYIGDQLVDAADDVIQDVDETTEKDLAQKLAREALKVSPLCVDAYNILAQHSRFGSSEAVSLWRQGVESGERYLGTKCFEDDRGEFWGLVHTRPYMRAKLGLALALLHQNFRLEAIDHLQDLLRLNPRDNQGVRYILAPALLAEGRDEQLKELLETFSEVDRSGWLWNTALAEFARSDENAEASLCSAISANRYVVPYLLGTRKVPKINEQVASSAGSPQEAHNYAAVAAYAWQCTPGACDWLSQVNANLQAGVRVDSRSRMNPR